MTEHIQNHDRARELLPWFINGTLSAGEQQEVERLLSEDEQARQEVEFLRALRKGVKDTAQGSPGEFGLRRLKQQIAQEKRESADTETPRWWRPALAAAALVIIIQGGVLLNVLPDRDGYTPLSGAEGDIAVLQIQFEPTATEAQIREMLQDVNGILIDGPSAVGLYRIQIDVERENEAEIARVMSRLEENSEVVSHVAQE